MNNEMNDFSIPGQTNAFGYVASPANYISPGKRPLSSISPTIVEHLSNGTVFAALGSAGGSRIITVRLFTHLFISIIQSLPSAHIHTHVLLPLPSPLPKEKREKKKEEEKTDNEKIGNNPKPMAPPRSKHDILAIPITTTYTRSTHPKRRERGIRL